MFAFVLVTCHQCIVTPDWSCNYPIPLHSSLCLDYFSYSRSLNFHINLWLWVFLFCKACYWNYGRDYVASDFRNIFFFMTLILTIMSLGSLSIFWYFPYYYTYYCVWHAYGGHRNILWGQFISCTFMWFLRIEFRLSSLRVKKESLPIVPCYQLPSSGV